MTKQRKWIWHYRRDSRDPISGDIYTYCGLKVTPPVGDKYLRLSNLCDHLTRDREKVNCLRCQKAIQKWDRNWEYKELSRDRI